MVSEPASCRGGGFISLSNSTATKATFSITAIATTAPRTGTVRIAAGGTNHDIPVTQAVAGALRIQLDWDTAVDMDLYVIEPGGTKVYWASPKGPTAVLELDDQDGFGPERTTVAANGAAPGEYQIYIVHARFQSTITTSKVQITLNAGTANAQTLTINRTTTVASPTTGINVATADVRNGVVKEVSGTRIASDGGNGVFSAKKPDQD